MEYKTIVNKMESVDPLFPHGWKSSKVCIISVIIAYIKKARGSKGKFGKLINYISQKMSNKNGVEKKGDSESVLSFKLSDIKCEFFKQKNSIFVKELEGQLNKLNDEYNSCHEKFGDFKVIIPKMQIVVPIPFQVPFYVLLAGSASAVCVGKYIGNSIGKSIDTVGDFITCFLVTLIALKIVIEENTLILDDLINQESNKRLLDEYLDTTLNDLFDENIDDLTGEYLDTTLNDLFDEDIAKEVERDLDKYIEKEVECALDTEVGSSILDTPC